MSDKSWEVVDEVAGELQAEILSGLLQAQGIEVWISQEGAGRAYQFGVGLLGRAQLLVPAKDSQRAREVLQAYYSGELEEEARNQGEIQEPDESEEI